MAPTLVTVPEVSTKDAELLRWGQGLAELHQADSRDSTRCRNQHCVSQRGYPCHPRRIADRLIAASAAGWPHCWTARVDALSCAAPWLPGPAGSPQKTAPHRRTAWTEVTGD